MQWREKRQLNQVPSAVHKLDRSIISSPSVSTSLCQQVLPFCIYEVLNRSSQGSLITNYYKTNSNLNESCRNLMIDIIISNFVEKNISMTVNLADSIATTISETFTSELKVNKKKNYNLNYPNIIYCKQTYFVRNTENKCLKGKLYSKYFNKMRNLKNHGLVPQCAYKKNNNSNRNLTRVSAKLDDELSN